MEPEELRRILDNESETPCFCFKLSNYIIHERIMIDQNSDVSKLLLDKKTYDMICKSYQNGRLLNFMLNGYQNFNVKESIEELKIEVQAYPLATTPEVFVWIEILSKYIFGIGDYICLAILESSAYVFILRKSKLLSNIFSAKYDNDYLKIADENASLLRGCKPFYKCKVADCNNCETGTMKFPCCSKCKKVKYCSRDCQLKDWKEHKLTCNK